MKEGMTKENYFVRKYGIIVNMKYGKIATIRQV
jgi:hypothetical protein